MFNSGALNFTVNPGDTQKIVVGGFVARGTSNLNSVTLLKTLSYTAQRAYDSISTVSVSNLGTEVPARYSLMQNYPNPFNPISKIKFDISKLGNVKITVYDVMGHEVETLVNEQLQPGTYSTEWNAANYSSGVYFYKLSAGDFLETKRMVLIK